MHARSLLATSLAVIVLLVSPKYAFCQSCTTDFYEQPFVDIEPDGLPDAWEALYFPGDLPGDHNPGDLGDDGDLLNLAQEYAANTNPLLTDSDGDGYSDSDERDLTVCGVQWRTDPCNPDSSPDLQCACLTECPARLDGEPLRTPDPNLIINPGLQWLENGNPIGWTAIDIFPDALFKTQAVPFHPDTGSRVLENSIGDRQVPIDPIGGFNLKLYWKQVNIPGVEPDTWYMFSVDIGTNGYRPYVYKAGDEIPPPRIEGQFEVFSGAAILFKTEGFGGLHNFRIGTQGVQYTNFQSATAECPCGSPTGCPSLGLFTEVATSQPVPMATMTRYFHIPKGATDNYVRKVFADIRGIGTTYSDNFVLKKIEDGEPLPDLPDFSRSGTLDFVPYHGMDFFPIALFGTTRGLADPYFENIKNAGFNAVRVDHIEESMQDEIEQAGLGAVVFTWHSYTWGGMVSTGGTSSIVDGEPIEFYTAGPHYMKDRIDAWANFENLLFFRGPDEWNNAFGNVYKASNGLKELYSMRDYLKCVNPDADLHYSTTPTFLDTDGLVGIRDADGTVTEEKTIRDWYYGVADSVSFTWNSPDAYLNTDVDDPRMMLVGPQTRKAKSFSGGKPVLHTALGVHDWSWWDENICLGGPTPGLNCRFDGQCGEEGTCGNPNIPLHLQRFQIWNSIINGATGVVIYNGANSFDIIEDPLDAKMWGQMTALATELEEMTPVLLEPEYYDEWTVEVMDEGVEDSRIEVMMKKHGDKIYLFATSVWYEDIEVVKFTLPNIDNITSVTVLNDFDNGELPAPAPFTIPHSGNTFMDEFRGEDVTGPHCPDGFVAPCAAAPGYATHIYEIEYQLAPEPPLPAAMTCTDNSDCAYVNGNCVGGVCECNEINGDDDCLFGAKCEQGLCYVPKNRYISIDPRGATQANPPSHHIRVTLDSTLVNGHSGNGPWWANAPVDGGGNSPATCISVVTTTQPAEPPNWSGCPVVHLTGCPIIPTSTYAVATVVAGESAQVLLETQAKPGAKWHGDCVGFFNNGAWMPPNGTVNADDFFAALRTFQDPNSFIATHLSVTDVAPNFSGSDINLVVNIEDVFAIILGFQGQEYPGGDLNQCGIVTSPDPGPPLTQSLVLSSAIISPNDTVDVSVFLNGEGATLAAYQVALEVTGGDTGTLELESRFITSGEDYVFDGISSSLETDDDVGGHIAALDASAVGVDVSSQVYLGTFRFRASADASGVFNISFQGDEENFLVQSPGSSPMNTIKIGATVYVECDDGNPCTDDSLVNGICTYVNDDTNTCPDGNDCTSDDGCVSGVCTSTNEPAGTTCNDGLFCTATDACDGSGTCVGSGSACGSKAPYCCEYLQSCGVLPCFEHVR